jgi:arginyl-tRNA synthetase
MAILGELKESHGEIVDKILDGLTHGPDPDKAVETLIKDYEKEEPTAKNLVRKVVEQCLEGFKQTLQSVGIVFDQWDWESELVWKGDVKKVIENLQKTPFITAHDNALALNVDAAARALGLKQRLFPGLATEIPPLILIRSDGTTLYTTRDIAYHVQKFAWADHAVNVIGVDQKLAQLQLKIGLATMGIKQAVDELIHYSYEVVTLPGVKMSRRRGRYVSFDDIINQAVSIAYQEVTTRSPDLEDRERRSIANIVGIGAV